MKKHWWLIGLIVFGFASLFYIFNKISVMDVLRTFKNASLLLLVSYAVTVLLIMMSLAWRWQTILKSQGHSFPFWTLFRYKVVGFGINFVTPGPRVGGEPVQASLLSRHGLTFEQSLSSIVIDKTIELTSSGFFFVIGAIVLFFKFALPEDLLWMLIAFSVISAVLMVWFFSKMLQGKTFFMPIFKATRITKIKWIGRYEKKILQFENLIVKFYDKDKKYFGYTILISLVSWLLMFFEYYFAMQFFGYFLTPLQIFLVFSFVGMAYLFPIPLALGVLEAAQISVFNLLNINAAAAVGLAMVIRFKDLLFSALGFFFLSFYSIKLKDIVKESIEDAALTDEINALETHTVKIPPVPQMKERKKKLKKEK